MTDGIYTTFNFFKIFAMRGGSEFSPIVRVLESGYQGTDKPCISLNSYD